mmetsp:Transcript_2227/g.3171  ORF Transcript_2227/g.3171 Transcript_2227/m.3171 type:complete len:275 (-) Transcript_2227:68-892(-)
MVPDHWEENVLWFFDQDNKFGGYTKGWPLSDFQSVFTIAIGYVAIATIGSTILKKAESVPPLDPYYMKFIYNFSQIFLCGYISVKALIIAYDNNYSLSCNPYNQDNPAVAELMWIFYMSKIWDFWDTIFIVLGRKWRQLSFLHIYHHFSVLLICWLQLNVLYDGDSYLFILLNATVHTIMYTYYLICMHTKIPGSGGKSLNIWWKSSLTKMQMIQFLTLMGSGLYSYHNDCPGYNHQVSSFCVLYTSTLLVLFAMFFVASYMKKGGKSRKMKAN